MFPVLGTKYNQYPSSAPTLSAKKSNLSQNKSRILKDHGKYLMGISNNLVSPNKSNFKSIRKHSAQKKQRSIEKKQKKKKILKNHQSLLKQNLDQKKKKEQSKQQNTYETFCDVITQRRRSKNQNAQLDNNNSSINIYSPYSTFNSNFNANMGVTVQKINTTIKPPHRYKTCLLVLKNKMILYGGIGCEKDLSWAKLDYQGMKWQFPKQQNLRCSFYKPQTPIIGHTVVAYKEKAVIFGGINTTQVNQTTILDTNTMIISEGQRAPFRRKSHAAIMYGDQMIIHGGIQAKQTKSDFLAYNVQQNKWSILLCSNAPKLSGHKIASTQNKRNLKNYYIFGGINEKGKCSNKLYSIKMGPQKQLKCEKINCQNSPLPRHLFCFQGISQTSLLLYGGKQSQFEVTDEEIGLYKGVFNDMHLFNIQTNKWAQIVLKTKIQHCFGMASSSQGGRVFIFGGSTAERYCDASITMICSNGVSYDNFNDINKSWEIQSDRKIRMSSKSILSKNNITLQHYR